MKLFYRKFGQGHPIIVLHGLFGSSDNWQTLGKKFSENYEVYLVDQRNHGQSEHSETWDYPSMSDDLLQLMDDNNLEKVSIIGHSLGGKTAMYFALNHPDRISKLIVVDISPKQYPIHHQKILDALNAVDLQKIKSRKEAEDILSNFIEDIGTKQFLLKNLYWKELGEDKELDWRFNLSVINSKIEIVGKETVSPTSSLYQTPVLFIRGERSDYILQNEHNLIYKVFPEAKIETVLNARHWVQADNPNDFLKVVEKFLK